MDIHYRVKKAVKRAPSSKSPAKVNILMKEDISGIINKCFTKKDLNIQTYAFYEQFSINQIQVMMEQEEIYVLPTEELCDFLDNLIGDKDAIEIGAGKGHLGRELNIPITDSYARHDAYPMKTCKRQGIQPIIYPNDVEKLDALQSVRKYKPHTVIASYLVHKQFYKDKSKEFGLDGQKLLKMCKRYIHIGNLDLHTNDPIMQIPHTEVEFPYLITKNRNPYTDRIFIWGDDGLINFEQNNGLEHYNITFIDTGNKKYFTEFVASSTSKKLREYAYYWMKLEVEKQNGAINIPINAIQIQKQP